MRTLITGATGRIGSRLVPRLLRTGPVRVAPTRVHAGLANVGDRRP